MTEHVCPVGALTTKDFRFKARVWFLRSAKSVCQGCATGCNAWLDFDNRTNKAYRYRPRDNEAVNKYWMCDEGMLSYRAAHEGRVTEARIGRKKATVEAAVNEATKRLADVAQGKVAFVLSAQHSLEDNWAMRELGKLAGAATFYLSGAGPGYQDEILISADKNSNFAGAHELAGGDATVKTFANLIDDIRKGSVAHVVALGGVTPKNDPEDATALGMLSTLVVVAAHQGALTESAHVVLPATSWAEHSGTYVNKQSIRQVAEKGLEPIGGSQPAWQHARSLAKSLRVEPTWTKLKDIRTALGPGPIPAPAAATTEAVTS
jgi:NADH-quinone oxidoreductase subunit G